MVSLLIKRDTCPDGDGIPNYLDPDNRTEQDSDGDGIPNEQDIDANGNGILDYAENQSKE